MQDGGGKPGTFTYRRLKLLVVSHSCATPLNQQVYAELRKQTGWDIILVVPERWRDEFGNVLETTGWGGSDVILHKVRAWMNGSIICHVYRQRWKPYLERGNFDAIYMNHEPYALATAQVARANMSGRKVPFGFYSCQNIVKHYPPPFRWMEAMVYRHSEFAFPITDDVASVLRQKGFRGECCVCPLPLDGTLYRPYPREEQPAALRREEGTVMLGFVGRVTEAKGLRTLAVALAKLHDLDWKFVLIGAGPFLSEWRKLTTQYEIAGRIIEAGFVPHEETPRYLAGLDILVLPSETQPNWREQFGRVIPEALACGAAVVGSDSGEIPKLVRVSGGGLIFPERNPEALAAALRELIADATRRRTMADAGRRWVMANISLDRVAAKMASTIRAAVGSKTN